MSESDQSGKRGCFFYGLIIGGVVLLILIAGGLFGLRYAKKMYNNFTAAAPMEMPEPGLKPTELKATEDRIDQFRQDVLAYKQTPPLELSAEEINGLIRSNSDLESLKGRYHVIIEEDQLKAKVSLPMDDLGIPIFKGRYLNGVADLDIRLKNGIFRLVATNLTVNGRQIPDVYMQTVQKQNLGKQFNTDPRAGVALERLEDIQVRSNKLVFIPKTSSMQ